MTAGSLQVRLLSHAAVRWGIDTLGRQRLHPTFVMYLYLRSCLQTGSLDAASASSSTVLDLLRMPGHPTKPYYFPLIDRGRRSGTPLASFWRSPNIPGSWSPGSLGRQQPSRWLVSTEGHEYTLPPDHVERAFKELLFGEKVSALALGAYFLRNDGFVLTGTPSADDVIAGFRRTFDFTAETDDEFAALFSVDTPEDLNFDWFEADELTVEIDESPLREGSSLTLVPNVRELTADDLGIGVEARATQAHTSSLPDAPDVPDSNPRVQEIIRLARIYGGVLLSGPPGTSKSYFAAAAAEVLARGEKSRRRFVQFHASYQYEDFMLGFSPTEHGFEVKPGPFLELVRAAEEDPDNDYVLVIDELSRADVGRVFGEALTYVERSKRKLPFTIANGQEISVPTNLIILATMNPFDRGVDEVDAAFERRFAKISMDPDTEALTEILTQNGMDESLQQRTIAWFGKINGQARNNSAAAVGHAYFSIASDEQSLRDIWDYQLKYLVGRAFRRDENTRAAIETAWGHIFQLPTTSDDTPEQEPPTAS